MTQERKKGRGFANKQEGSYEAPKQATQIPSAQEALAKAEAIGKVRVVHGSADGDFDNLVGVKVSTVKLSLVHAYNIPGESQAFVNGEAVNSDYALQANDTLEFIKQAGVKGGGEVTATIDGDYLVIRLPLQKPPKLSASGKNFTVASSFGNKTTEAEVNGKKVTVGVNAYVRNDDR